MDAREKKILKKIASNLYGSSQSSFNDGDVYKWADYANSMKSAIRSAVDVIDGLTEDIPEEIQKNQDQSEEDFLSKNS